jgi:quercetin 2,3-dioxygenase
MPADESAEVSIVDAAIRAHIGSLSGVRSSEVAVLCGQPGSGTFFPAPDVQTREAARQRNELGVTVSIRPVRSIVQSRPTMEGAGVRLRRAFGFGNTEEFDPFLLFDDFRNENPEDYLAGFPWHPHRGIETITYVLAGNVSHGDSLGNKGTLGSGDVQWMTAGSGILHQEMPRGDEQGRMHGFQLWANLPASRKMTSPRYQDVKSAEIPEITDDDGTTVRVVCGEFWGKRGPVEGIAADPRYLDVRIPPGRRKTIPVEVSRHAFAYIFDGEGVFHASSEPGPVQTELLNADGSYRGEVAGNRSLVLFDRGDGVTVQAGDAGMRFLLVSGEPLKEPVAWAGPIVMNTDEELRQAYAELRNGTFIHGS